MNTVEAFITLVSFCQMAAAPTKTFPHAREVYHEDNAERLLYTHLTIHEGLEIVWWNASFPTEATCIFKRFSKLRRVEHQLLRNAAANDACASCSTDSVAGHESEWQFYDGDLIIIDCCVRVRGWREMERKKSVR